jgi:hypothetical protein
MKSFNDNPEYLEYVEDGDIYRISVSGGTEIILTILNRGKGIINVSVLLGHSLPGIGGLCNSFRDDKLLVHADGTLNNDAALFAISWECSNDDNIFTGNYIQTTPHTLFKVCELPNGAPHFSSSLILVATSTISSVGISSVGISSTEGSGGGGGASISSATTSPSSTPGGGAGISSAGISSTEGSGGGGGGGASISSATPSPSSTPGGGGGGGGGGGHPPPSQEYIDEVTDYCNNLVYHFLILVP